jgi:hypothetical protein
MSFEEFKEQNVGVIEYRRFRELQTLGLVALVEFDLFIDHVNPVAYSYDGDMIIYICEGKEMLDCVMEFIKKFKPSLLEFFTRNDDHKTIYIDRSLGDGIIDYLGKVLMINFGITVHSCS